MDILPHNTKEENLGGPEWMKKFLDRGNSLPEEKPSPSCTGQSIPPPQDQLLESFIGDLQIPGCVVQLGTLEWVFGTLTRESCDALLKKLERENTYLLGGVNPEKAERAGDDDVLLKNYLFIDFDIRNHWKKEYGEEISDTDIKEIAEGFIHSFVPDQFLSQWRYVVFTGNGVHFYYFGTPVPVTAKELWKCGMKRLLKKVEELAHMPPDTGCTNIGRMSRMPGSYNWKNNRCVQVAIIHFQDMSVDIALVERWGEEELRRIREEAQKRAAEMTVKVDAEESTHAAIQRIPIASLVCRIKGWETDGRNFWEPGQRKRKACFVPKGENFVVHGGTDHFPATHEGYSPFEFVKYCSAERELTNAEVFEWFKGQSPAIAEASEKEWKEKNAEAAPMLDSRFHICTKRESEKVSFTLLPVGILLEEPEENHRWVVQDMLPSSGISLLAAKPKVGKSTEARNLALCVARGLPYLGRITTLGPVIYLALEEKRSEVRHHFRQMGVGKDDPILVHTGIAPEAAIVLLEEQVHIHKPILVIVDPLFQFLRVREVNDYAEVTKIFVPLRELARKADCHILTTHHHTKMERSGGDGILGSTAIFGVVDTAIIMKKREGGQRTIQSSQRYGIDLPEMVVSFDGESGQTSAVGELHVMQIKEAEAGILAVLGAKEMSEEEIREEVGGNRKTTGQAIRSLLADGKLFRTGDGKRGNPYQYRRA